MSKEPQQIDLKPSEFRRTNVKRGFLRYFWFLADACGVWAGFVLFSARNSAHRGDPFSVALLMFAPIVVLLIVRKIIGNRADHL